MIRNKYLLLYWQSYIGNEFILWSTTSHVTLYLRILHSHKSTSCSTHSCTLRSPTCIISFTGWWCAQRDSINREVVLDRRTAYPSTATLGYSHERKPAIYRTCKIQKMKNVFPLWLHFRFLLVTSFHRPRPHRSLYPCTRHPVHSLWLFVLRLPFNDALQTGYADPE